MLDLFLEIHLNEIDDLTFDHHCQSIGQSQLELIATGRWGGVIVDRAIVDPLRELIPLVRTTTMYTSPVMLFNQLHRKMVEEISKSLSMTMHDHQFSRTHARTHQPSFNNALIEIYDQDYKTMGFHSDQALDLAKDSYIAIYSCYKNPSQANRRLIIKNKTTKATCEILLKHNSVVCFSTETNKQHLHKIVLDQTMKANENEWLGITFRSSETFVYFIDKDEPPGQPMLCGPRYLEPTSLRLATSEEKLAFYKARSLENALVDHYYPLIDYTISPSDLIRVGL